MNLGDSVTGEASEVAKVYAALARQIARHGDPMEPPVALISGGECTVTVRGNGRGGRCTGIPAFPRNRPRGHPNVYAIACDTDGLDGTEDNAGAVLLPESSRAALASGSTPRDCSPNNDAFRVFSRLEDS